MFLLKTWACSCIKHGHVLAQNIRMFCMHKVNFNTAEKRQEKGSQLYFTSHEPFFSFIHKV